MTSEGKMDANRRNSRRSTGPRTAHGKARVRRNALRHGLAASTVKDPARSIEVDRLAAAICGKDADPMNREQALIIAESELTLSQVCAVRVAILEQMSPTLAAQAPDAPKPVAASTQRTTACGVYLAQLVRLDRYERRAFSRRKRAMRAICLQ
jgi:hypothetical protein